MSKDYPNYALITGWVVFLIGLFQMFIWGLWLAMREPNKYDGLKSLFKQNPSWGPKSPRKFKEWMDFKNDKLQERQKQSATHSKLKKYLNILLGKYN